jgi:uncharacterized protein (TIGR02145 family)
MKKIVKNNLFTFVLTLFAFLSCNQEEIVFTPTVSTGSVDEITATSAKVSGNVTSNGGADVTDRGIFWGVSQNPEVSGGTKLSLGNGNGIFSETIDELTPGVKYYVKAYAQNSKGTTYGNETFFTTLIGFPQISTIDPAPITSSSVSVGGSIASDGGSGVVEKGIFWSKSPNANISGVKVVIESETNDFTTTLDNLLRGTTYYVKAFATNAKGSAFGEEKLFSTLKELPTIATLSAQDITINSAIIFGEITSDGGANITEKGFYWGTTDAPETTGTKIVIEGEEAQFSKSLDNLNPGATYFFVAYAENEVGKVYGSQKSLKTQGNLPIASTTGHSNLKTSSVTLKGIVSASMLITTVTFEYGTSSSYGNSITAQQSPITADNVEVSAEISGLQSNTTYHYRVVAQNVLGASSGRDSTFKTVLTGITGSVTDADNNTYNTIGIGYQQWMTTNLKTTKYRDGTKIPKIQKDSLWRLASTSGFCWYNNDSTTFAARYGALYNWHAVSTSQLCPSGWHVPSQEDIEKLVEYVGGSSVAGGKLKQTGTSNWESPNEGAVNEFGFNALAAGKRDHDAVYDFARVEGVWWTSSNYSTLTSSYFSIIYKYSNSYIGILNKKNGASVRCVKD